MTLNSTITYNGAIPSEGPQAIGALIDQQENQTTLIDLSHLISTGKLSGVQTIFVDLNSYAGDVTITSLGTNQTIVVKGGTQGYYPILATNLLKFNITNSEAGKFNIYFINFPIALGVWGFNKGGSELIISNNLGDGLTLSEINGNNIVINQLLAGDNIELIKNNEGNILINSLNNSEIANNQGSGNELLFSENDMLLIKKLVAGGNVTIAPDDDGNLIIGATGGGGGGMAIEASNTFPYPLVIINEVENKATVVSLNVSSDFQISEFETGLSLSLAEPIFKPSKMNILNEFNLDSLGGYMDFTNAGISPDSSDFIDLQADGLYFNSTGIYTVELLINADMTSVTSGVLELDLYFLWADIKSMQTVKATVESGGNIRVQFTIESYDSDPQYNTIKLQIYSPVEINNCTLNATIIKISESTQSLPAE